MAAGDGARLRPAELSRWALPLAGLTVWLLAGVLVALLWPQAGPGTRLGPVVAAWLMLAPVLLASLRLFRWLWLDQSAPVAAHGLALGLLAFGATAIAALGDDLLGLLRGALPGISLLVLGLGSAALLGTLLPAALEDLARIQAAAPPPEPEESLVEPAAGGTAALAGPWATGGPAVEPWTTAAWPSRPWPRLALAGWELVAVAGTMLVAALLRTINLTGLPYGFHGDEGVAGLEAQRILQHGSIGPYSPQALGMPAGPLYLEAITIALLGNTILAVRLMPALVSTLSVLALYVLVRRNLGATAAVVAAAVFASLGWHIHFARIGFPISTWPLVYLLALLALTEALRSDDWRWWAGTGALLSLGLYVYNAHALFIGITGLAVGLYLLASRRLFRLRTLGHLGSLALALLLVAVPMLLYALDPRHGFFNHFGQVSLLSRPEWQQLGGPVAQARFLVTRYAGVWDWLLWHPRPDGVDGIGATVVVPAATVLLAVAGLVLALRRRQALLWIGLAVVLCAPLGAVLTVDGFARRTFLLAPVVALFAGYGLSEAVRLARRRGRVASAIAAGLLTVLVLVSSYQNLSNYFIGFAQSSTHRFVFAPELAEASRFMATLPAGSPVYFYAQRWSVDYETRRFLAPDIEGHDRSHEFGQFSLEADPAAGTQAFVLIGSYRDLLDDLRQRYPGGEVRVGGDARDPLYVAYVLRNRPAEAGRPATELAGSMTVLRGPDGAAGSALDDARALAVDASGHVYVVEAEARQVLRLAPDGHEVARWGAPGDGEGQFREPVAVAVDGSGLVHVLDSERGLVQVFTAEGRYQRQYGAEQGLYHPRGLALGDDGLLYLADTGGNRVLRFQPDGQLRDAMPSQRDQEPSLFDQPTAAVAVRGVLFVAEPTRSQISRLQPAGRPAVPWPITETDTIHAARLARGPAGEVVVADVGGQRVLIACPTGDRLLAWRPSGSARPLSAALAPEGRLYVTDDAGRLLLVQLEGGC